MAEEKNKSWGDNPIQSTFNFYSRIQKQEGYGLADRELLGALIRADLSLDQLMAIYQLIRPYINKKELTQEEWDRLSATCMAIYGQCTPKSQEVLTEVISAIDRATRDQKRM